jgi:hypothetical protein
MITNFEQVTENLSNDDLVFLQPLINGISKRTKDNPIKARDIVVAMNNHRAGGKKFSEVLLRKLTNYIRSNGVLPLIATSDGYYCSTDSAEIIKQIQSLEQRARSIQRCADGLNRYLKSKSI